ncbi:hypothetical protein ABH15_09100 [Methanoculleus taiwanensis]|uniref:Uncharacterized protein n=1 Tax=Methanoculleus taiwanensis TaxID=1550565 RepID=A0A498H2R9_9EURY|nr:hypothetical protein [Methanoculleus taiwanensis]RXE56276.1 hypothetical protein ABH15_09100 [Methanoculleus taiwanensis]
MHPLTRIRQNLRTIRERYGVAEEYVVHGTASLRIHRYLENRRYDLIGIDIAHPKPGDDD